MANLCDTTYKCVGDKYEILELYGVIKSLRPDNENLIDTSNYCWLGNIIHLLGEDWEKYSCRGTLIDYFLIDDDDNPALFLYQETAWGEQEGLRRVIEKKFPDVKVYFREEEPGCELYNTNSFEHFPEKYLYDDGEMYEYFCTFDQLNDFIKSSTGSSYSTMEDLTTAIEDYNQNNPDHPIFIHEFKEVNY